MSGVYVYPHALKNGLTEDETVHAWANFVRSQWRETPKEDECMRIEYGTKTLTVIQMMGVVGELGVLIVHPMAPPQKSVLNELGMHRSEYLRQLIDNDLNCVGML